MSTVSVSKTKTSRRSVSPDRTGPVIPPHVWVRIALIGVLFVALHWDILYRLVRFAWTDGDWSHAFIVPLISLYFIHQRRDELTRIQPRTCWWGLPLLLLGMAGYFLSIYPIRNDMLKGYSMIFEIFAIVLLLAGPRVIAVTWLPIVYLAFAVKVAEKYWSLIASKLQFLAAKASVVTLQLFGIDATVSGTKIDLWKGMEPLGALNVAEACSGLRMLMTFIALGVAMAYLWDRPWWARLIMVLLTVPIAVAVNVGRVTMLGLLYLIDPKYAVGDFHLAMGMFMLIPAGLLFLMLGWVLDKIVTRDDEPQGEKTARGDA